MGLRLQEPLVSGVNVVVGYDERDLGDRIVFAQKLGGRVDGDPGGIGDRVAVHAAADRRKGDRAEVVLRTQLEGVSIAAREDSRFAVVAAGPDRADGVNDVAGGQPVAARDLRFARAAAVERFAFGQKLGTGGAVNGAIDSAAAEQARVRRVHDGVNGEGGDVATNQLHPGAGHLADSRKFVWRTR